MSEKTKNTIVIYQSKYGATRKYAEWLETMINCDCVAADDFKSKQFNDYDNVIFGGGIHAGGITGISIIKKNLSKLKNKKVIIFAVGINIEDENALDDLKKINFNKKMEDFPIFLCKGAYDPFKVKGFDKWLMKKIRNMIMRKPIVQRTDSEVELVKMVDNGGDWTDKKYLEPIIEYLK